MNVAIIKIAVRLAVSVLLVCGLTTTSFARGKKKASAVPTAHSPLITSVSGNSVTVTDQKTAKTLTVNQFTEIMLNGQRATLADLKPGMTVNVTLGTSPTQASRIAATSK